MVKGSGKYGRKKTSHHPSKLRCCVVGCKKKARYVIDKKTYCKKHVVEYGN